MRQRFTVIEGGAATSGAVVETLSSDAPLTWRVDLRRATAVGAEEVDAWRALLVRAAVADPVHADPDYLLSAAQHQAGGRDIVFALAWAVGNGRDRLGAVVPLALPHTLWGQGRIVLWQPHGTALAPSFAPGSVAAVHAALVTELHALRPRATLVLDAPIASASEVAASAPRSVALVLREAAPAPRLRAVARRGSIPAHSLVGIGTPHAPAPVRVERIGEPQRIRDAVEAFLILDAEVSGAPIIGDPSEAALVRVVTRLFARRRQVTVALTRREDRVVAASITLGAGADAVLWRHVEGAAAPERVERSA